MRSSAQFSSAVRHGQRVRRGSVVVHVAVAVHVAPSERARSERARSERARSERARSERARSTVPVVGFVVGKSVGNSVVRHRVSRRLRAIAAARLGLLPAGSATVVRALPSAAEASSAAMAADLDSALARAVAGLRVAGSREQAR